MAGVVDQKVLLDLLAEYAYLGMPDGKVLVAPGRVVTFEEAEAIWAERGQPVPIFNYMHYVHGAVH